MSADYETFAVPPQHTKEMEAFIDIVKQSPNWKAASPQAEMSLIKPQSQRLGPGEITQVIWIFSSGAAAWITGKWIDAYVWPELQKRIDKPSKEFVRWVMEQIGLPKDD